jgi:hypothetical protein
MNFKGILRDLNLIYLKRKNRFKNAFYGIMKAFRRFASSMSGIIEERAFLDHCNV